MDRDREPNRGQETPQTQPHRRSISSGSELAGMGLQFAFTILVFVFGGVWLDGHFHTSPWFTLGCTFAGAGGGFYSMYRRVATMQRRDKRDLT